MLSPVTSVRRRKVSPAPQVRPVNGCEAMTAPLRWTSSQTVPSARCQTVDR